MHSVLVLDPDPAIRESLARQLSERGFATETAADAEAGLAILKADGTSLLGLITNIDLTGMISGWDMARIVRDYSPQAAIGYLARSGQRDWAMFGVPDSIIISGQSGDYTIPDAFYHAHASEVSRIESDPALPPQLQKLDDIMRSERSALHAHFQQTPRLIAVLEGPEHCYTFANHAYVQLVERDVVGKTVVELFPEAVEQGYVEILDRVFRTGEEFVAHAVEFVIDLDDHHKRALLDITYRPIFAGRNVTGIFVECTDLTAMHAAQVQISTLQDELIHIARVNAMGLLASTLAHELNQPLTAISNFMSAARMIAKSAPVDERIAKCIEGAAGSAIRAGTIIRRLRDLTTKGPTSRQDVAIESVVREAIEIASTGRFDAKVECDFQAEGLVHADPIQLQQVVLNFLQNAFDATEGAAATIHVTTANAGSQIMCSVRDHGTGIPPEVLGRIFESFVTTKAEGMGIGLSLAKTIIEGHGGTIAAHNNDDGGATLTLSLPRVR